MDREAAQVKMRTMKQATQAEAEAKRTAVQRYVHYIKRTCNYLRQVNGVNGGDTVFVRYVSVCVSVRSGPVSQTRLKRLKLRTSNMTCMFPGTART